MFHGKPKIDPIPPRQLNRAFTSTKHKAKVTWPATFQTLRGEAKRAPARLDVPELGPRVVTSPQTLMAGSHVPAGRGTNTLSIG